jgi:hypothetical protein
MVQTNEKVVSNESCYDLSIKRVEHIFDSFDGARRLSENNQYRD